MIVVRLGDGVEMKARRVMVEVRKVDSERTTRREAKSVRGARGRRLEPVSDGDKREKRKRSLGRKRRVRKAESRPRGIFGERSCEIDGPSGTRAAQRSNGDASSNVQ